MIKFKYGKTEYEFNKYGYLTKFIKGNYIINRWIGGDLEPSQTDIYVKVGEKVCSVIAGSELCIYENGLLYRKNIDGIEFLTKFYMGEDGYRVTVDNDKDEEFEYIYLSEIGLNGIGDVRASEYYSSQYIDIQFKNNGLYFKQNMINKNVDLSYSVVSKTDIISYGTDGYDIYSNEYRRTNEIKCLKEFVLPSKINQQEHVIAALHTKGVNIEFINGNMKSGDIGKLKTEMNLETYLTQIISSRDFTNSEIDELYSDKKHIESDLSFFTKNHSHVILNKKELLTKRSHGHIMISANSNDFEKNILTSTTYMNGVFNSHIAFGNTNMDKVVSHVRDNFNIGKFTGQRILVEIDGEYKKLGMPGIYELGFNYSKWHYAIDDIKIEVISYTSIGNGQLNLEIKSSKDVNIKVTTQVTMNVNEFVKDFNIEGNNITHENISFKYFSDGKIYKENGLLVSDHNSKDIKITIAFDDVIETSLKEEVEKVTEFYKNNLNGFNMNLDSDADTINTTMYWFTNNMLTHFLSPHGLEQSSGAAWGTRDVNQGPFEYYMCTNNFDVARKILVKVFESEFKEGRWPQWFMFDKYSNIYGDDSHGDVVVWPIRALGEYIYRTGDRTILSEKISFIDVDEEETIEVHINNAIEYIKSQFINGKNLISYGEGDWNDSLQPADQDIKNKMVSSWTVGLLYETLELLEKIGFSFEGLTNKIKDDFNKYLIKDDVLSGFAVFYDDHTDYLMHPSDTKTNIKYRLLPMQRGIISNIFTKEQAENHYGLIKKYLLAPDGARLMSSPTIYKHGKTENYLRSEQASNFGREIGLNYIHAHIRFIEASCKLNKELAYDSLFNVIPIGITEKVKNANLRQSNAYFSSSDACFNNRLEANERYNEVMTGDIKVDGGWRIYSSGSGIFINQVITNILGIKVVQDKLVISPSIPESKEGLEFEFNILNKKVKFIYRKNANMEKFTETQNKYGKKIYTIDIDKIGNEVEVKI